MSKPRLMVNDLSLDLNKIKIELALIYDNLGYSPKARIIFKRGDEIRRLPILLRASFDRKYSNDSLAIFSYTYLLDYVFTDESDDDIAISFEITNSDMIYEDISFVISDGLVGNNNLNIDKAYIADDEFEGAAIFTQTSDDIEEEDENDNIIFTYIPEPQNNRILIKSAKSETLTKKSSFLFKFFTWVSGIIALFFSIILIPYFVIDGLLAALNLVPRRKSKSDEGLLKIINNQIKANIASYIKAMIKDKNKALKIIKYKNNSYIKYYRRQCKKPIEKNTVTFISGRRDELGGNEQFVYDILKNNKDIKFRFLLSTDLDQYSKGKAKKEFYKLYATSKVVIVDDYYNLLNTVDKRDEVKLFQLWHACGAFKTFGFSRIGKPGGPKQKSPNHRMYDYTIVSSKEIIKYYAEGFGISDYKILPTGIPRTDIFFDEEYSKKIKNGFYERYPQLKDKKIIMFAPTFRGQGQNSAYYPLSVFNPEKMYDELGGEYAIIIKLHPFCSDRFTISDKYKDFIIDLSEEDEINDLLFVTDLLITDYSSCIFEASLLEIPMLFYAYDLYQYISERDFYCDFESFVPGKIVFNEGQMTNAIKENDFESYKINSFKNTFFTDTDGKSSQRVADSIINALKS